MKPRNTRAVLCRAIAVALAVCAFGSSASRAQQWVSASGEEINIRSGPGTRFAAVWKIIRGYPLRVVARQGGWLKIRDFEGDQGWVYRPLTGRAPHHIVKARDANLRARPSVYSRVVARLSYGEVVATLAKRAGWIRVRQADGTNGWVAQRLVWGW